VGGGVGGVVGALVGVAVTTAEVVDPSPLVAVTAKSYWVPDASPVICTEEAEVAAPK
jgi:hypothetical protein